MRRVEASVVVPGRADEAEALWLDPSRWASWVDGFASVKSLDPRWPEPGTELRWISRPRGRGLVAERVVEHEPARTLALAVEDQRLNGLQRVTFTPGADEVRVTLSLEYTLKERAAPLVDLLFIRRSLRDSLRRTAARFANERRAELEPIR